ncbi:MAG: hypothetical protein IKR95_04935 [Oscillospiraceae bacterium]|nr:hypothetical protein [Oscillospiraceae bacterium]
METIRLNDFDYDLWTSGPEGAKRYWARVRSTGQVTEIDHEVMKYLRKEEKRGYRELADMTVRGTALSLDSPTSGEPGDWAEDRRANMKETEFGIFEEEFRNTLTPNQLAVYESCMLGSCGVREYARRKGVDHTAVIRTMKAIRKKTEKFFYA